MSKCFSRELNITHSDCTNVCDFSHSNSCSLNECWATFFGVLKTASTSGWRVGKAFTSLLDGLGKWTWIHSDLNPDKLIVVKGLVLELILCLSFTAENC